MRPEIGELRQSVALLERDSFALGFIEKSRIERGLFLTAKTVAAKRLSWNLVGFSFDSWTVLGDRLRSASDSSAGEILLRAFELRSALGRLFSANPYTKDFAEELPGRMTAQRLFARRLARYLDLLEALAGSI